MRDLIVARQARILVVEDEDLVAETISSALGDDYSVCSCRDATQALGRLAAENPDVVLLDLLLPGGRAADVIAAADLRRVPVILMTGDVEQADKMQAEDRAFLSKPFSIDALLEAVSAALRRGIS